jgi:ATP-binding cassette subfamily B protein
MKQPLQPQIINSINEVVFSGVDFTYPHTGIHAINNLDLQIKRGEKVAIIGKTGSGKSTIALLLLRMYDTDKGMITLNGHNIKDLDIASLRRQISYVPQEVFLFSDTVVNNINFGSRNEESNSAELSAERASINEEIKMLPDGFDTMVGERGVTLSGGQKQRISIARALSKEADLLVFDDCLSAVDAKTEHRIASSLNQFLENRTALIITHRIFPSFKFDQIVVMENGTIFEKGTHEELMNLKGYYYDLLRLQEGVH